MISSASFSVHRLAFLVAGGFDDPFHGEALAALRTDFARHLIVRAADAAGADFHGGSSVFEGGFKDLDGIFDFGFLF